MSTGRTHAEPETSILWPPDVKNWLTGLIRVTGKDPDSGKGWRRQKGMTEDEMVGWYHRLNGHESEQALGVGDGQESLACCSPWGYKESGTTEWLNWTDIINVCHICHLYYIFIYKYIYIYQRVWCMIGCFSHVWLFATLWTIVWQAYLFMVFSRQEY